MFSKYLNDPSLGMICSDEHFIRKMLDFEIALAQVQAILGIIPKEAAQNIEEKLKTLQILPESLAEGTLQNGIPTITLINLAKKALSDAAKDYLHWGATSQDVMDTAQVLIIKEVIPILEKKILELLQNLAVLIDNQGNLPTIGRTRTQQAVPILFGQKIANWASPLIRHLERLAQLKPRLLVAQLGGAAGNLSALGDQGLIISEALAKQLALNFALPWHNQRDNFAEFTNWLALLSESLGKMGQDILLMSQTEINEVIENADGGGKSSTMPHKNNPILSETLLVLAKKNANLASIQLQSMIHGNERDGTAWLLEWENLPKMILNTGTALNHALTISKNLKANPNAMQKNIDLLNGLVFSEAASFILAQYLPRNEAKIIVEKACQDVVSEGKSLEEVLLNLTYDLKIDWHLALNIDNHLGVSREIMNKVVAQIKHLK
ncbi:class-II fumarase/aspartase family protein [Emticicia sp. SJ17W-69]|uniref:class-II fumarase/aspartase family protein n=1 Tax=Emticicia sp. SJ17W-69 TaxID=3421657 RepID=UPI003EBF6BD5